MTYEDVFELAVYDSGVRIDNVGDLDNLEAKLVDNHKNCKSTVGLKEIDEWVLDTMEDIDKGKTGIYLVDSWLASVTKSVLQGGAVYSVDVKR